MEVHPQVKYKWLVALGSVLGIVLTRIGYIRKLGAQITDSQKEEAEMKARQYVSWLDEQFFKDGCGSALLLLPVFEIGKVIYRNEYRGFVPQFWPLGFALG